MWACRSRFCGLPREARVAVLEMGMNHAGEIRDLCAIAKPRIGVVTNVGHAHMEAFDSIEGIAAAKRELIEALPSDGIAVLNADDPLVSKFRDVHRGRTRHLRNSTAAPMSAPSRCASSPIRRDVSRSPACHFESPLMGRHSVSEHSGGTRGGLALRHSGLAQLVEVVKDLSADLMRGERLVHDGIVILNDCYNSNPDAARAMIDVLRETPAQAAHRRAGGDARTWPLGPRPFIATWATTLAAQGIDVLVGIRGAACH